LYYAVESTAVAFGHRALADLGEPYGIAEHRTLDASRNTFHATIVRGVLNLPVSSFGIRHSEFLLDATGRHVLDLRSGPNDVSGLAPGVYFLRLSVGARPGPLAKLIVAR
jgi:hypothetical protein